MRVNGFNFVNSANDEGQRCAAFCASAVVLGSAFNKYKHQV